VSASFIGGGSPDSRAAAQALFPEAGPSRRYVVLDRDGTIIVDKDYLSDPAEVALLPGVRQAFARFRELGVGVIVVTNQSGIGRGYFSRQEVDAVHARMRSLLGEDASVMEAIYICPHVPADDCQCRKPRTGLLQRASAGLGFCAADCIVIGDKACDIDLGRNMDAATILVQTGYGAKELATGRVQPDFVATNLGAAAEVVASLLLRSE
jgi:D-glycero-D-manno-heptose 1,7-bisphosphate phosphatase